MTNPQSIPIKDRVTESHLFGCLCLGTYILLSFPLIYLTTTNLIHQILESRSYHYILLHALLMYWWYSSSFLSVLNMMNALMNFLWLLTIGGIFLISFVGGGSLFPLSGFFWWIYLCFLLRKKKQIHSRAIITLSVVACPGMWARCDFDVIVCVPIDFPRP